MSTVSKIHEQGFSLVETLVAITILLIVITGPMAISTQTARSTSFSSEQVLAFFLAQEGLEIAQKGRDDIILANFVGEPVSWSNFIDKSTAGDYRHCFSATGCRLEVNSDAAGSVKAPVSCSPVSNCRLYYNESSNRSRYTYTAVTDGETPYTRVVRFDRVPDADTAEQIKVTSTVTWRTGSQRQSQKIEVESYLFKVYEDR
jgi:prepilin-type N-terminal cleavage/methylation domain-containing protein